MMRRRVISCVAMSGLAVATLLSVVGASSSAGTLPGRPASAEVLEETTARVVGTCTNAIGPTANCAVNLSAAGYCQTTYGAPPVPFGAGGCNAAGGGGSSVRELYGRASCELRGQSRRDVQVL